MSEVPKCTSWLGHKFRPRFSTANPALEVLIGRSPAKLNMTPEGIVAMRISVYEGDICERCGHILDRPFGKEQGPKITANSRRKGL